jgi:lipopolysaccharide transport system ATP-binding protein
VTAQEAEVIRFERVTKRYSSPMRTFASYIRMRKGDTNSLTAVNDVSFSILRGQAIGLIGANGSGKSTCLKLLAGITPPTSGEIEIRGRVSSLIEVGAGFHSELSGRDNVFLNGAILGMSRGEIADKYERIVDFAELAEFMDMPVKHYSSGMFMRLGLSVAVHTEPDILLVDEVLAVGDARFQARSLERMKALMEAGTTVLFVSHSLNLIQGLCVRGLYLRRGCLAASGPINDVIHQYLDDIDEQAAHGMRVEERSSAPVNILEVVFRGPNGQVVETHLTGQPLTIEIHYATSEHVSAGYFNMAIADDMGGLLTQASMLVDIQTPPTLRERGLMSVTFDALPLLPRSYQIWCEVLSGFGSGELFPWSIVATLRVRDVDPDFVPLSATSSVWHVRGDAPVFVPHRWTHQDSEV